MFLPSKMAITKRKTIDDDSTPFFENKSLHNQQKTCNQHEVEIIRLTNMQQQYQNSIGKPFIFVIIVNPFFYDNDDVSATCYQYGCTPTFFAPKTSGNKLKIDHKVYCCHFDSILFLLLVLVSVSVSVGIVVALVSLHSLSLSLRLFLFCC